MDAYEAGYDDGRKWVTPTPSIWDDEDAYNMGYTDGFGDRNLEIAAASTRPVEEAFANLNDAPRGFAFTGEKRTPVPGDWYLSKNGNVVLATKVRGNAQTRHILRENN